MPDAAHVHVRVRPLDENRLFLHVCHESGGRKGGGVNHLCKWTNICTFYWADSGEIKSLCVVLSVGGGSSMAVGEMEELEPPLLLGGGTTGLINLERLER